MRLIRFLTRTLIAGFLLWFVGLYFVFPYFVSASPTASYVGEFGSFDTSIATKVQTAAYNPIDGKIYTTDGTGQHFIIVYNLDGTVNRKIRTPYTLTALDVAPDGKLYVTADTSTVLVYGTDDQLLTSWGTFGTGNGQFQAIYSIRYSPVNDRVYITDNTNRVQAFTNTGTYITSWVPGTTAGYLAISPIDGTVYVGSPFSVATRVKSYDPDGNAITSWGPTGTGDGQFSVGTGPITVDSAGKVYVTDGGNHRVQIFQSDGTFINKFGSSGTGDGQFDATNGIVVVPSGDIYVSDTVNNLTPSDRPSRVEVFDSTYAYKSQFSNTILPDNGKFDDVEAIAPDADGNLYITDSRNDRVQLLDPDGNFIRTFGSSGTGDGQFDFPSSLTLANGKVYVLDGSHSRIEVFDTSGNYLSQFGSNGSGDGQFGFSEGVTSDADGNIYVADGDNNRIEVFDASGTYLRQWSTYNGGTQFNYPDAITYSPVNGHLYVIDSGNYAIVEFDTAGNYITSWGSAGTGNGELDYAENVVIDSAGNVFVSDSGNNRIQVFDKDGTFITTWGSQGTGNMQFDYPTGLAVVGSKVYVFHWNQGDGQAIKEYTLDLTVSAPVISSPTSDEIVNRTLSEVSGTGEAGATVDVSESGSIICTTTVDGSGNWTCSLSSPITQVAEHTISVIQTDTSGNVSTEATRTFKVVSQLNHSGSVASVSGSVGNGYQSTGGNTGTDNTPTPPTPVTPSTPTEPYPVLPFTPHTPPPPPENTVCVGSYFTESAHIGSIGTEVMKIQRYLTDTGFYRGKITGFFGPVTEHAVKAFQEAYYREILIPLRRIKPTGVWSYSTIGLANKLICLQGQ